MNLRLLAKVLGLLLLLLAAAMLTCLGYALLAEDRFEGRDPIESLILSAGVTAAFGLFLYLYGRKAGRDILRKEAIAVVGLGWLFSTVFGALPYVFSVPSLDLPDALFESASGFSTTGASVITDLDAFPRSILLWRALTQWLGGLGILVLFVALLSYLGVGSKALFRHESSAKTGEGLRARIQDVAMRLWQIYVGLTILCALGLVVFGMDLFEAACHSFTALSTGGFGTRNESIAAFNSVAIELWLVLFMTLGAVSFMLYAWLLRGNWDRWKTEEETKVFLGIIGLATLVIAMDVTVHSSFVSPGRALRDALFQVTSIITTTGFVTADFDQWPPLAKMLLLLLMAVGGCAGSTAGGTKVSRVILFVKSLRLEALHAFRPNLVARLKLNGNPVDDGLRHQVVFFVALAGVTAVVGTVLVCLMEPGFDIDSSFAAVMTTLFNVGPGLGAVGPTKNFAHLESVTKLFLGLLMIFGRLEFSALLVLFMPSLWRKY
jgi:trk system potassium uptake protein TrkH